MQFDINKINVSSSRLNPDLLDECNRLEFIEELKCPEKKEKLIDEVKQLVIDAYPEQ